MVAILQSEIVAMESLEKRSSSTALPVIIDSKFCMPHTMHLIVKPKKGMFKSTLFNVLDTDGNKLLKIVKGDSILMNKDRLILDASGSPIATLRRKNFSWHDAWRVYRGKNRTDEEDAIFRVKRKDGLTLNVFMGSTDKNDEIKDKKKKKGEFDIVGFPPTFYMGDTIVADVNNSFSWGGDDVKKGFKVRVGAGTDYAFIISLVIIHREMALSGEASGAITEAVVGGGVELAVGLAGVGDGGGGGGGGDGGGGGGGGG